MKIGLCKPSLTASFTDWTAGRASGQPEPDPGNLLRTRA